MLVAADYSQLEFRAAAFQANCPVAKEAIKAGLDVHALTTQTIFNKTPEDSEFKKYRQKAKAFCVPLTTTILTRNGWKTYEDVNIGEDVMTYNHEKDVCEWQPLLEKAYFEDEEVVELGNSHWKTISTPNHRWYGHNRRNIKKVFTTETINTESYITVSAPLSTEDDICHPDLAALIGWVITDGTLKIAEATGNTSQKSDCSRRSVKMQIHQVKKKGIREITYLMDRLGLPFGTYSQDGRKVVFNIPQGTARALMHQCGLGLDDVYGRLQGWVLRLSPEALRAFFDAAYYAEGCDRGYGVRRIGQNIGEVKEAIHLAGFLLGHDVRVCITKKETVERANYDYANMTFRSRRHITGQRLSRKPAGRCAVWCPRTANGTWVMRQGETISITGNTFKPLYGGLTGTKTQQEYFKAFLAKYSGIAAWQQRIMAEIKMTGKWKDPYTGKVFKYNTAHYYETKAKNYPVQFFAAVVTQAAMIGIHNKIKEIDGIDMILQVHDAIVLDCKDNLLDKACTIMYTEMVGVNHTLKEYFGFEIDVPMEVELTSGSTYYDQKEMIEENGIWSFKTT
jgi:hypothetical protein